MPDNIASYIMLVVFVGVGVLAMGRVIAKFVKSKYSPVTTATAIVVDKHIVETFSKYAGTGKCEKYVIVFSVEGKKKSFYVSQFTYNGYRVREKGTLKYKGEKLIEFGT